MTRTLAVGLAVLACCATLAGQGQSPPEGPRVWVAFSADIRITFANGKEAWGRRLQDEHGCTRDEMVHPDGSALITLINFQTETTYRLYHGSWTSQPMRIGQFPHTPRQLRVTRKVDPIEGFDAYLHEGAAGFGGFMSFSAVVLRLSFAGQPPLEAVTTEESAYALKTPSGIALTLVTSVTDPVKRIVRVRVLTNASGRPGDVRGDLLDEVTVPLGSTGATTKLGETLTIAVTRVAGATK